MKHCITTDWPFPTFNPFLATKVHSLACHLSHCCGTISTSHSSPRRRNVLCHFLSWLLVPPLSQQRRRRLLLPHFPPHSSSLTCTAGSSQSSWRVRCWYSNSTVESSLWPVHQHKGRVCLSTAPPDRATYLVKNMAWKHFRWVFCLTLQTRR